MKDVCYRRNFFYRQHRWGVLVSVDNFTLLLHANGKVERYETDTAVITSELKDAYYESGRLKVSYGEEVVYYENGKEVKRERWGQSVAFDFKGREVEVPPYAIFVSSHASSLFLYPQESGIGYTLLSEYGTSVGEFRTPSELTVVCVERNIFPFVALSTDDACIVYISDNRRVYEYKLKNEICQVKPIDKCLLLAKYDEVFLVEVGSQKKKDKVVFGGLLFKVSETDLLRVFDEYVSLATSPVFIVYPNSGELVKTIPQRCISTELIDLNKLIF